MALRFSEIAAMWRKNCKAAPLLLGMGFLLGAALLTTACGGDSEPADSVETVATQPPSAQDQEQHIRDLEVQLESLEQQSEAMRREVLSRLDQIDVTREALAVQLMSLRGETVEPAGEVAVADPAAAAEAPNPEPVVSPAATSEETSEAASSENNPFLRFLLLIFILAAIFFLARIFFDRWGDPEDGERPPSVEATTDLGKIRFPPGTEAHPDEGSDGGEGIEPGDPDGGDDARPAE